MSKIPILSLRLLDIKLKDTPKFKMQRLLDAKDLARQHLALFEQKGISIDLFHNKKVQYSGIQITSNKRYEEWTAIGKQSVKALKLWAKLEKKQNKSAFTNTIKIIEQYSPMFLDYKKKYAIDFLLVSNDTAKEIKIIKDKFALYDRLEKYLFGNILVFFQHIDYYHDKNENFLKITVEDATQLSKALPVFHDNKKIAFRINFSCNFLLPQTLRLGQSTALGYGKIDHL